MKTLISLLLAVVLLIFNADADPLPVSPAMEDYDAICAAVEAGTLTERRCFYVSQGGDDSLDGRSAIDAWQSITKVNNANFQPGDIIRFKRGEAWRLTGQYDALSISDSGESDDWITFGAYGEGDNPQILGSIQALSWTHVSGNIWVSATPVPINPITIYYGSQVFFEGDDGLAAWGHYEAYSAGFNGLDKEHDWTWNNGNVYIYTPDDPNLRYASVEVPQAQRLVLMNDRSYIAFDSLTIKYMVSAGIYDVYNTTAPVRGFRLTNAEIAYIGIRNSSSAYGLALRRSDIYVAHSKIHDCGRRSISLNLYNDTPPFAIEDVLIENTHFFGGFHTTGIDAAAGTATGGGHVIRNMTIRNNFFDGDPTYDIGGEDGYHSNHIWMFQSATAQVENTYIIGNLFTYAHGSGAKLAGGHNYRIYNNTFYKFNTTIDTYQAQVYLGAGVTSSHIINNIFQNDASTTRLACIRIEEGEQDQYTIDYNLYYSETGARLLWGNGSPRQYAVTEWDDYRRDNPAYDAHSPHPADPQFIDPPANLMIGARSPGLGAARRLEAVQTDYLGQPILTPPDMGAIGFAETKP